MLDGRHVAAWGSINFHRTVISPLQLCLTVATRGAFWSSWSSSDARSRSTLRSPSDGGSYLTKNHDRHAIVARSARDRRAFSGKSGATTSRNQRQGFSNWIRRHRLRFNHDRGSWSRFDRGLIAPRSGLFHRYIKADSSRNWSHEATQGNRSHDPCNPPPRPHQSATIFGQNFPLKACILPSCSSTFDRFIRKLSKFRWRS